MKAFAATLLFIILASTAIAHSLDEYPGMYVSNGKVNAIVVVSNDAPATYVIVQTGIALSLNEQANAQQQGVSKLASEVSELTQNTISIGNPCENEVSAKILGNPANCLENYRRGTARIELIFDEERELNHIVVGGFTEKGTLEAAKKLKDAAAKRLGEFTIIEFAVDEPVDNPQPIEEVPTNDIAQQEQETIQEIEEQPASSPSEPSQGLEEAAEDAKKDEGSKEGLFGKFFLWLRGLFG